MCSKADQEHATQNLNYSILVLSVKFTCTIASKLLLYEGVYSHRMWPQHKTGEILYFRAQQLLLSSPGCFPPHFDFEIPASLKCAERLTWAPQQQTGVYWLCLFHPCIHFHTHTLKCRGVWGRSMAPREPIAGQHCEVGGFQPFREPQKNSLWNRDQPTDRDTTQLQDSSVTDKLCSTSFPSHFLHLQTHFPLLSISCTSSSWIYLFQWPPKTTRGRCFPLGTVFTNKCFVLR